jgi:hypothetical protein
VQEATLGQAVADVLGSPEDLGKAQAARAQVRAAIETFADGEGDGWPDAADNCPQVWNPSQDDYDGDGLGDACAWAPVPVLGGGGLAVLAAALLLVAARALTTPSTA